MCINSERQNIKYWATLRTFDLWKHITPVAILQGGEQKHNRSKNTDICESFFHGLGI